MKPRQTYGLLLAAIQAAMLIFASPARAADGLVLAFGDSLIAGPGLKPSESFPAQLEASLRQAGHAVHVQNAGVSGDTSAAGRGRLGWVLASLKQKPALVILELGANDMLRGLPPAQTRVNLDAMLADLKKRGIPVLIAGMRASPNLGKAYQAQFDSIYPQLAKLYGEKLYPFFMGGVTPNRALLNPDQLHPNAKGVAVIVRGVGPLVAGMLR